MTHHPTLQFRLSPQLIANNLTRGRRSGTIRNLKSYDHQLIQTASNLFTPRFLSSRAKAPLCKFISAASFIGKPVSVQERSQTNQPDSIGFRKWVEDQKKSWLQVYRDRYPNHTPSNPESLLNSGDDWWFIHEAGGSPRDPVYLGVADGVGGWVDNGIDPAEVSQGLMFHSTQVLEEQNQTSTSGQEAEDERPGSLVSKAYLRVLQDERILGGASTALIARLDPIDAQLEWANLGDSSMLVIKGTKRVGVRTNSQTHYFNCPYQLTKFPMEYPHQDDIVTDTPEMADRGSSPLDDGDLVMLYTDGLGDNLWPEEILHVTKLIAGKNLPDSQFVNVLAHQLCAYARVASLQGHRVTPFEVEARRHGINDMKGGKVDDVTLIVALARHNTT